MIMMIPKHLRIQQRQLSVEMMAKLFQFLETKVAFLLDNSETCYFINSYDDLKAIYTGKEQMPSIDFKSYTLIIGQKLSNNVYQNLDKQSFYERDGVTYLDLYFSGDIVLPMLVYFNYWGLYPKMSKRDINVNIIENRI